MRSTHLVPHRVSGIGQASAQPLAVHTFTQVFPQAPQFWPSVMSTSQPSEATPLQSANPGAHRWNLQAPELSQAVIALAMVHGKQTFPHPSTGSVGETQRPLQNLLPGGLDEPQEEHAMVWEAAFDFVLRAEISRRISASRSAADSVCSAAISRAAHRSCATAVSISARAGSRWRSMRRNASG